MQGSFITKTLLFAVIIATVVGCDLYGPNDPEFPSILMKINREVNSQIEYESDLDHYGKSDVWVISPEDNKGDCEDYALTKREKLIEAGISRADIGVQFLKFDDKGGIGNNHAVLVYKNKWILDNLTDIIWTKEQKKLSYYDWHEHTGTRTIYFEKYESGYSHTEEDYQYSR